jgi:hypothetical protein
MEKRNKPFATFEVFIGGMFIAPKKKKPKNATHKKAASLEPRKTLIKSLNKETNLVKHVWDLGEGTNRYSIVGKVKKGRFQELTYSLDVPILCHLEVRKGTRYIDLYGRNRKTSDAFNAILLHNGIWFMAIAYNHKYESLSDYESPGPEIRDIYETMLTRNGLFNPLRVSPSIIPRTIKVSIYKKATKGKGKKERIQYKRNSVSRDASELILEYMLTGAEITNEYLILQILLDIYYNLSPNLDDFYINAHDSNRISLDHEAILDEYDKACKYLRIYYSVPFWNVIKKCIIAGNLKKKTSDIQVRLVNSRLSQLHMLTEASKIDMYEDRIGVIQYIKSYLKECVEKDFIFGKDEYEGLSATVTHMNSIAVQQDVVILAVVAIVAGIIGAVIGAVFG